MAPGPLVANDALREAVLAGDVSLAEVARRLGHMRPDTSHIRRALGLGPSGHAQCTIRLATRICRAAHLDPVDVGL